MLPQTIVSPFSFIVEALTTFSLNQALALTTVGDDHNAQLGIDLALTVPIAAGCAYFYFCRNNQFWVHGGTISLGQGFDSDQSVSLYNGSTRLFLARWL